MSINQLIIYENVYIFLSRARLFYIHKKKMFCCRLGFSGTQTRHSFTSFEISVRSIESNFSPTGKIISSSNQGVSGFDESQMVSNLEIRRDHVESREMKSLPIYRREFS